MKNYRLYEAQLVPTRVGMILLTASFLGRRAPCPHTRGDDPEAGNAVNI